MIKQRIFAFFTALLVLSAPAWSISLPSLSGNNDLSGTSARFVPVDEAFMFNFRQQDDQLILDWQIKQDYYLYQHAFEVSATDVEVANVNIPPGVNYHDEYFGDVVIYRDSVLLSVDIDKLTDRDDIANATVSVTYQGCADAGLCYPPETRTIPLLSFNDINTNSVRDATDSQVPTRTDASAPLVSEQDNLAGKLASSKLTPVLFLLLGIGLAFTPCVLPMYPILSGIVLGGGKRSHGQALGLAIIYVQGMALTYTLLGLVVASAGMQFQAAMQHPYVLIGLSVLFVVLAMSMFGVYTLQLPSALQTRLNALSNEQQGGQWLGVFTMGAISGLVCSPCTTAPLSGALLYVAQSGDLLLGGLALYALAIGMGIPLILVAVFGNKLLPRSGPWMDRVKIIFGFILLAVPLLLLERIIDDTTIPYLWALLGLAFFGWIYHLKTAMPLGWKGTLVGIVAILGMFAAVQPVYQQWFGHQPKATQSQISFQSVANREELDAALAEAKAAGKPVMLDFYADWCVACKEFERYTFHTPAIEAQLGGYVLLQADVTRNTPEDFTLLNSLDVLGLPTIDFWDSAGHYRADARVTGFMNAERFGEHLTAAALSTTP